MKTLGYMLGQLRPLQIKQNLEKDVTLPELITTPRAWWHHLLPMYEGRPAPIL